MKITASQDFHCVFQGQWGCELTFENKPSEGIHACFYKVLWSIMLHAHLPMAASLASKGFAFSEPLLEPQALAHS